ncbi:hypothetical protein BpHYR1_026850 [Brachionus plicatilis]|uniref:Uncharacterized protein n=1 Tax=Brachionus plicatilis TaxID=10195 RepID=A0A3M7S6R3_BRAPC|nr:hypothetical protein BpHYR1_026850 [Brachionus plicatilis]
MSQSMKFSRSQSMSDLLRGSDKLFIEILSKQMVLSSWPKLGTWTSDAAVDDTAAAAAAANFSVLLIEASFQDNLLLIHCGHLGNLFFSGLQQQVQDSTARVRNSEIKKRFYGLSRKMTLHVL